MSDDRAKTIQFFLPQGEPRGVRIADITTRIVQAMLVPRTKLPEAMMRPELKKVGVYFLIGEPEESAKPMVYIGEAEECDKRLAQHNVGKGFWHTAVAVVSKTDSLTKAHVRYLEWYCIEKAREAGRFALDNGSKGSNRPRRRRPMGFQGESHVQDAQRRRRYIIGDQLQRMESVDDYGRKNARPGKAEDLRARRG